MPRPPKVHWYAFFEQPSKNKGIKSTTACGMSFLYWSMRQGFYERRLTYYNKSTQMLLKNITCKKCLALINKMKEKEKSKNG